MATDGYLLSEEAVQKISNLLAMTDDLEQNRFRRSRSSNFGDDDYSTTAEIYVALTPSGGIPALDFGVDVGTGSGSGSGGVNDDIPGSALCDVYKVQYAGDTPYLVNVPGSTRLVLNLNPSVITGKTWVLVVKDKYGTWFITGAVTTAASVGDETITARLTARNGPYGFHYAFIQTKINSVGLIEDVYGGITGTTTVGYAAEEYSYASDGLFRPSLGVKPYQLRRNPNVAGTWLFDCGIDSIWGLINSRTGAYYGFTEYQSTISGPEAVTGGWDFTSSGFGFLQDVNQFANSGLIGLLCRIYWIKRENDFNMGPWKTISVGGTPIFYIGG